MMRYGAVVLAAGKSERFGRENKLLHEIDGAPLLRRVVLAFVAAGISEIVVVLGYEADAVKRCLDGLSVGTVRNADYEEGMGVSLACGASVLDQASLDGVFLCVGDLPYLSDFHIDVVRHAFEDSAGSACVVPGYQGIRGHPVCLPASYLPELKKLSGDEGARRLFSKGDSRVLFVELPDDGCIRDMDSRAFYE